MTGRRRKSSLSVILLVVSLVMIGYGGYMSVVDLGYEEPAYVPPTIPDAPDVTVTTTAEPEPTIVYYTVRPLPDLEFAAANIFGGDGTVNLANIILFLGIGLFIMSFLIRR